MASIDWHKALDFPLALKNVTGEFYGDWHVDPWHWPELDYLLAGGRNALTDFCNSNDASQFSLIDVPKENWGTRPAVVLNPIDRLCYQALVDRVSLDAIGKLSPNAFGWRLHAVDPKRGVYSHNNKQWDLYRRHLALGSDIYQVALKTDVTSFFSSIPPQLVQEELEERTSAGKPTARLLSLLQAFSSSPHRTGLPQRSRASAVLANMVMMPLDDVLTHHANAFPEVHGEKVRYHSFARWMDDIWLFLDDEGKARKAQIELQQNALRIGLNLNSGKTDVITGTQVAEQAKEIEHSAIDDALLKMSNTQPLEALVDSFFEAPEKAPKTSVKFAAKRLIAHSDDHRVRELAETFKRMPHAADSLAELFGSIFTHESLEEWFLDYTKTDWALFDWTTAQYGSIFESGRPPRKETFDYFSGIASHPSTPLPLYALACQRVAAWDAVTARALFRAAIMKTSDPHARRVIALAALNAGEGRRSVKAWLEEHDENRITLAMLEDRTFSAPDVHVDYA